MFSRLPRFSSTDMTLIGPTPFFMFFFLRPGGPVIDLMNRRLQHRLTEPEILKIFSNVCEVNPQRHLFLIRATMDGQRHGYRTDTTRIRGVGRRRIGAWDVCKQSVGIIAIFLRSPSLHNQRKKYWLYAAGSQNRGGKKAGCAGCCVHRGVAIE